MWDNVQDVDDTKEYYGSKMDEDKSRREQMTKLTRDEQGQKNSIRKDGNMCKKYNTVVRMYTITDV